MELLSEYGSNSWKLYNQTLKIMHEQAENQLEDLKKSVQAINFNRKNEQTVAGVQIKSIEQKWIGLVSKNYEIECAIVELEKELAELRKKRAELVTITEAASLDSASADIPNAASEHQQMEEETKTLSDNAIETMETTNKEDS